MLNVTVANIGELTVVGCEGRIDKRESANRLREAVTAQTDARIIVLELSEVRAIGGGGPGMLAFLQRWAREHNTSWVRLCLITRFCPKTPLLAQKLGTSSFPRA